jgi:hypothetical protein
MVNTALMRFVKITRPVCGRAAWVPRVFLGVVAYPASILLVAHVLNHGHLSAGATIVLLAAPGLVLGALVRRWWILGVPPVAAATWLIVSPGCANGCGEDDATTATVMAAVYVVLPAMIALLVALCAGRSLGWLSRLGLRRPATAEGRL